MTLITMSKCCNLRLIILRTAKLNLYLCHMFLILGIKSWLVAYISTQNLRSSWRLNGLPCRNDTYSATAWSSRKKRQLSIKVAPERSIIFFSYHRFIYILIFPCSRGKISFFLERWSDNHSGDIQSDNNGWDTGFGHY